MMKRFIFLWVVIFSTMSANAQAYYKCTGDNVNVRKGPGLKYENVINAGFDSRCQLFKGNVVRYTGKKKNGFMQVVFSNCGMTGASCYQDTGWIYAKYLKLLTKKCPVCGGRGFYNKKCTDFDDDPSMHPGACLCQSRYCLHDLKCQGKQHCNNCAGIGYLVE